ncbi:hypothetical protein SEA_IBANTIK_41 [Streptomyces phage Ibantik]|uniref:Uncharacterized protein n=1 Tax=Streptomyces phage Ibantik TaxID=2182397 RepID=A0A2U8UNL7_9CAUD|nr:hypothetical protein QEH36_gp041 [Streptomyces phage Ibantik]AWN05265.1 hypothetical protein SEA_IBANTIK_41 [Streptomyces phage Ibantik]
MKENSMVSSSAVQGGKFGVGDKVRHGSWGEGHVVFGPFHTPTDATGYLVEDPRGKHFASTEELLEPVPRFEVGQKVRFEYTPEGESYELIAGPFPDDDESFYVYKDKYGNHDISFEKYMRPVVE